MILIIHTLLLAFESGANEYPAVIYGIMPYVYNNFYQPTTIEPESEESAEEEGDSEEYVICTCEACSDISCEEYCRMCPQQNLRKYKERTFKNIRYGNDKNNPLQNYKRLALRNVETTPTYKIVYKYPKELNYEDRAMHRPNVDDTRITNKQNEVETNSENSMVKLTNNKDADDIINIEFVLNDRDNVIKEELYVNTPIRRTKVDTNDDLANTYQRHIQLLRN